MTKEKIERKIAVIFATDVVDYSKHMEANESETIHNLRACETILNKLFEKYEGRLFNTGGDSFLAEFPSAVSAVECAVEFQQAIKERNLSNETSVMLEFRIGINSGDVVKQKENLLGDGVNIAARLEALAQTGGVTISKVIYDFVKGKTAYEFYDLGLQKVKQNEFHAFDLLMEQSQKRRIKSNRNISKLYLFTSFAAVLALGAIIFFGIFDLGTKEQVSSDNQLATVKSSSPVMLVYPFENLSSSEEAGNFSEAVTESMISSLSRYKGISVLSSSTSSDAKSKQLSDANIKKFYKSNQGASDTFMDQMVSNNFLELNKN